MELIRTWKLSLELDSAGLGRLSGQASQLADVGGQ